MEPKIKIILAKYQELYRKSLVVLLNTQEEFEIAAEAADENELIEQLKYIKADIVLLDIDMPVIDGKKILQVMKNRFPDVRLIVLSAHLNITIVSYFMTHGTNSYLSVNCSAEILFNAIRTVKKEGYFFDHFTSKALLETMKSESDHETNFNDRETEIVRKICDGKTNKEIASILNLSTSTIDFHKGKIYSKANCSNATELLRYALKKGLVALS